MTTVMALDLGTTKCGVALGYTVNNQLWSVRPLLIIPAGTEVAWLTQLITKYGVKEVVMGCSEFLKPIVYSTALNLQCSMPWLSLFTVSEYYTSQINNNDAEAACSLLKARYQEDAVAIKPIPAEFLQEDLTPSDLEDWI